MQQRLARGRGLMHALVLAAILILLPFPPAAHAQVGDGATLTVLRGEVALIHPNGTAVQPAPSGIIVQPGDEIRTLTATGALITFYVGTEIELGPETILVVDRVEVKGGKVDISLKQVLGTSLSRVQSIADPTSAYRIEAGGSVAVVRGSTLAVRGPEITPTGVFVSMVCIDCGGGSYVEDIENGDREPLGPQARGYTWGMQHRPGGGPEKRGEFEPFKVQPGMGPVGNAVMGITTAEHSAAKEVGHGPPGRAPLGQIRERAGRDARDRRERPRDGKPPKPLQFGLNCTNLAVGSLCIVTVQAEPGVRLRLDVETKTGPLSVIEPNATCGPAGPDGLLVCPFHLIGNVFQKGHAVLEIEFPDGERRREEFPILCVPPRDPGALC